MKAIISKNPNARMYNEVEIVETFDFTYSVQALKTLLQLAKLVKASHNPTDTELVMAECALQIGEALKLS